MRAVASFSRFDTEVAAASSMSGCRGRRSAGSGGERGGELAVLGESARAVGVVQAGARVRALEGGPLRC